MSRSLLTLREVSRGDAAQLAGVWQTYLRRGTPDEQHEDLLATIDLVASRPDQRLVVAEYDGTLAGAVFLQAATISPVNPEPVMQVHLPSVLATHRRHGIGKALVEAGVTWAEELGIGMVATAAESGSREANRFMARLSMGPRAMLRLAPTPVVRAKLVARHPGTAARQVTHVLAARRTLRSSRSMSGS